MGHGCVILKIWILVAVTVCIEQQFLVHVRCADICETSTPHLNIPCEYILQHSGNAFINALWAMRCTHAEEATLLDEDTGSKVKHDDNLIPKSYWGLKSMPVTVKGYLPSISERTWLIKDDQNLVAHLWETSRSRDRSTDVKAAWEDHNAFPCIPSNPTDCSHFADKCIRQLSLAVDVLIILAVAIILSSFTSDVEQVKNDLRGTTKRKHCSEKISHIEDEEFKKKQFASQELLPIYPWTKSYLANVAYPCIPATRRNQVFCYVVAKLPVNYASSGISLRKQQQLDSFGARDFTDAVAHTLTVEERESLMLQERQRLRTFEIGWSHESYLSSAAMAQAGFYYLGDSDKVQCVFCRGVLHNWLPGDRPMEEHSKHFRNCKLVRGQPCGNIPYNPDGEPLQKDMLKNIKGVGFDSRLDNAKASDLGINLHKASKPEYAAEASRIRTFGRFPAGCPVPAEQICEAGFYYTGFDDTVKCFWCEGGLEKWARGDKPWEEHAKNFPTCQFLQASNESRQLGLDGFLGTSAPARVQSLPGPSHSAPKDQSYYAGMIKYCEGLGYNRNDIDKVIKKNKRNPFSTSKEMLEALWALEDGQSRGSPPPGSDDGYDAMETAESSLAAREIRCKSCRTGNRPSHIGLPCGCMILCADCASQVPLRCPTCQKTLHGVMRVYLG